MTRDADIPDDYRRGSVILWVEDRITVAYLGTIWPVTTLHLKVAGGKQAVTAIVNDPEMKPYRSVFGLVDRDFGTTNEDDWLTSGKDFRRFVLPVHELENLLLDEDALAGCAVHNLKRPPDAIRDHIRDFARRRLTNVVCGSVLSDLDGEALAGFPESPSADGLDLEKAELLIRRSPWYQRMMSDGHWIGDIGERLRHCDARYRPALDDGSWKQIFPGKDLFRHAVEYIYYDPRLKISERSVEAAKAVAEWQKRNKCVPKIFSTLWDAIMKRVGQP